MAAESVDECAIGKNDMVGEFDSDIEEGVGAYCFAIYLILLKFTNFDMLVQIMILIDDAQVPYVTGNILWAVYQFIVFIVLLRCPPLIKRLEHLLSK